MNIRKVINLFVGVLAAAVLLTSNAAFAEATLPEVYQAVQSGQMAKADAMMKEVLQNHPNSAKAHYVASELYLKEGKLEAARNHFIKAQNLAPGLPFAQPESVQKLQVQLASGAGIPAASQTSIFSNSLFWGLIAILVIGVIIVMKRRKAEAVQVYNAPSAGYPGTPGGPAGYPGGPGGPGYPGAPAAGGMGSGLMGSLATGAALGAGMYAGQALASSLMGGHDNGHSNAGSNPNLNQVGGPASLDPNFGVRDASSWDDGGASSWDDSGGGDFMSDV
ncbi:tetratricopeptide repeat protein [Polynucleobacter sp. AP-Ainpum-60-G11]|uniref:tetratricopeptide repeat protein n=1 Tax=Polynucleobacter sp. AP-Ainpum-60-G11 TaxID=2576926 RepID=UPI001BFE2327|nr:tetratricopeptide repeat protein [Polynucleobacter sp. AP-Ainpum-60-G11]QWE26017.1 tetratricopeptide repeat protein [Polynucleobacter sp. AP-Ainpum-60-G11]